MPSKRARATGRQAAGHAARRTSPLRRQLDETLRAIRRVTAFHPQIAVVLGSGLGGLMKSVKADAVFDYASLPHMVSATAPGHEGKLLFGTLAGKRLVVLAGRFHAYEGHSMAHVAYPVRLVRALGADALFLTSIVGSMNPEMPPGSLVLLKDHINLMGVNPLTGPNDESFGPRFPDMSEPYDVQLRRIALDVAAAKRLPLSPGVYVAVAGPNLETKAEYRMLRMLGADVVGMSMVPEAITARHGGMRVLAVTVVSDACFPDTLKPADIAELLRVAGETEPKLTALLTGVIERFA